MPKNSILSLLVKRTGHPLILTSAVILWWYTGASDAALLVTLTAVILLIEVLQTLTPAKPAWRVSTSTKFRLLGLYALTITGRKLDFQGDRIREGFSRSQCLTKRLTAVSLLLEQSDR
jgi:hypothetical protein